MSYEIIKKCGTKCLIKQGEPHRIIGTVNDEVAKVISELQGFSVPRVNCDAATKQDNDK